MNSGERLSANGEDLSTRLNDWIVSKETEVDKAEADLTNQQPDLFSPTVEVLEAISAAAALRSKQKLLAELKQEFFPPKS